MTQQAIVEIRGPIGVIRYENPPENLIGNRGAGAIMRAVEPLLVDPQIRVIILTGSGPGHFIRHADVDLLARAGDALAEGRIEPSAFVTAPFVQLCAMLDAATKPVIAAIDGPCMGGGFEIALACTLRVASEAVTSIGLPEIRLDIFPGGGGTQRLTRTISPHAARRFILLGMSVGAQEAKALGIIDEVAPDALTRTLELAQTLATRSPAAIAAMLALTRPSAPEKLVEEVLSFAEVARAPSARDRMRAFVANGERLDEIP